MRIKNIPLMALLCLFLSNQSYSQEIDEIDVPMKLIMNHYALYNNCVITQWKHYDEEDGSYTVDFVLNETEITTTYSKRKVRTQEDVILKSIDSAIYDFLESNYDKYKVYKLIRVTKFKHGKEDLVYHKLLYLANKEIEVKFFDKRLNLLNQSNLDQFASK